MRILLTGAGGFLGRHIASSPDIKRHVLFIASADGSNSASHVSLGPRPWTKETFSNAISVSRPDIVIHCAGVTHGRDTRSFFESNTLLAAELIGSMSGMPEPPKLMLIGSAAEYGHVAPSDLPIGEDHPPSPRTPYAISKLAQTHLGMAAGERGMDVITVRLFNAIGIGMPANLAIPSFARRILQASQGAGFIVTGNLDVKRDFIDVREASRIILQLAALTKWPWPVVNVCSGRATSMRFLVEQLMRAAHVELDIKMDPTLVRHGEAQEIVGETVKLFDVGIRPSIPDYSTVLPAIVDEIRALDGLSQPGHGG